MREEHPIELFTEHTPPGLERIFGYRESRRWVAFFWGKKIDDIMLCYGFDGNTFNPLNQMAWDAFFNHTLIVAMNHKRENGGTQRRFEFGNEHLPSKYWLLLDRWERLLYAAEKEKALYYLKTANDLASGKHSGFEFDPLSMESDKFDYLRKNGALQMIGDMVQWLDKRKEKLIKTGRWPVFG
ncbi:MAG: hypothetical protein C4519_16670 [Desulfobacteraceae bacterium]|nr:MAG: hypothetical protein C4519_16670 [Desulfobacteraceae bacterium]